MDLGSRLLGSTALIGEEKSIRAQQPITQTYSCYPTFTSDWSNVQLDKFYNACGIVLADHYGHKEECFDIIRLHENSLAAHVGSPAKSS